MAASAWRVEASILTCSTLHEAFPGVPQVEGDLFGGVATGLAYA